MIACDNISEIRSIPSPHCYLCGKPGHLVHADLEDKLFGVPGTWNFRECSDKECGLFWMDPMPSTEDLPKLYASYYTHDEDTRSAPDGLEIYTEK